MLSPVDGSAQLIDNGSGISAYSALRLTFYRDGKRFTLSIGGLKADILIEGLSSSEPLSLSVPIKALQPLMRLTTNLQDANSGINTSDEKGQFIISGAYQQDKPGAPVPLGINFASSSSTGAIAIPSEA